MRVVLVGADLEENRVRWQSEGTVVGNGTEITWVPASPDDQLRVAVRSRGGVSLAALRPFDNRSEA